MVRTSVLRRIQPLGSYHNPGRPLVAEIALNGPFHQVPELLFFRRDHPGRGDRSPTIRALTTRLDPRRAGHSTLRLYAEYLLGYVGAIRRAPLSTSDRLACYRILLLWLVTQLPRLPIPPRLRSGRRR